MWDVTGFVFVGKSWAHSISVRFLVQEDTVQDSTVQYSTGRTIIWS